MKINISIIIPVYNSENYLIECVKSIENQRKDIQIILIDDGSTDASINICQDLVREYSNIVLLRQNNKGPGIARNLALKYAIGKYVFFVDSDDYLENNEINKLFKFAEQGDFDAVIGGYKRVNNKGEVLFVESYSQQFYKGERVRRELIPKIIGSSPKGHDNIRVTIWNVLFKKEIIEKYKISFLPVKAEDTIFNIDFYSHADKVLITDTSGYCYRENSLSLTSLSYKENFFQQSKRSFLIQRKKLQKEKILDVSEVRLFRQFFIDTRESLCRELTCISGKNKKASLKAMKKIMNDSMLLNMINLYPIDKLEYKQKIFLKLIKLGHAQLMYFFIKLYIFSKMNNKNE